MDRYKEGYNDCNLEWENKLKNIKITTQIRYTFENINHERKEITFTLAMLEAAIPSFQVQLLRAFEDFTNFKKEKWRCIKRELIL